MANGSQAARVTPQRVGNAPARAGAALAHAAPWALRLVALALLLLPCLWMAGAAFMPTLERLDHPLRIWPAAPTLEHFASVWSNGTARRSPIRCWSASARRCSRWCSRFRPRTRSCGCDFPRGSTCCS
jgi:ABC-type glycerol-3-phosphate transport system permease component